MQMKIHTLPMLFGICLASTIIFTSFTCQAANEINFDKPWTIYRKAGSPVEVVNITLDTDVNGYQIAIYKTTSGEEGFVDISNFENISELLSLMNPGTESQSQVDGRGDNSAPLYSEPTIDDEPQYAPAGGPAKSADVIVALINQMYGNVCHAELNGFFSKTLKLDWTSNTNKFHAIKVISEIGSVKESLYLDGVRYFQFPNDAGTYNVIDWKTGEKESVSDTARYYFPD